MPETLNATVTPSFDKKDVDDNKFIACLSYLGILFLVPLLLKKDSKYCQEHAKQGLIMFIVWVVGALIFWMPLFGWAALLVVVAVDIIALVKCYEGEFWEIPAVGQFRHKFNL